LSRLSLAGVPVFTSPIFLQRNPKGNFSRWFLFFRIFPFVTSWPVSPVQYLSFIMLFFIKMVPSEPEVLLSPSLFKSKNPLSIEWQFRTYGPLTLSVQNFFAVSLKRPPNYLQDHQVTYRFSHGVYPPFFYRVGCAVSVSPMITPFPPLLAPWREKQNQEELMAPQLPLNSDYSPFIDTTGPKPPVFVSAEPIEFLLKYREIPFFSDSS